MQIRAFKQTFASKDMKIDLKIIPGASRNCLKKTPVGLTAYLTAPPDEDRANKALLELLAGEFGLKKSPISIIKGLKSRYKTVNINEP